MKTNVAICDFCKKEEKFIQFDMPLNWIYVFMSKVNTDLEIKANHLHFCSYNCVGKYMLKE